MTKRNQIFAACALAALGGALAASALAGGEKADKAPSKEFQTLMRKKLAHSQSILEGLALEDFDKIKAEGKNLKAISLVDEWKKYSLPGYDQLSTDFRSAADKMTKAAEDKNLDGATVGFMQTTMTCVECHRLIRGGGLVTGLK